jgi:hypothetical protein
MRIRSIIILTALFFLNTVIRYDSGLLAQSGLKVKGVVFHDKTGNGLYDHQKDKPLKGVAVSNGREVVITDKAGMYELPLRENSVIFVVKPRNWMVPVDENQVPRFYYLYSPGGTSGTNFKGLPPTGSLPESVDFPLYPSKETDKFDVLVLGDTQPRDGREIYYMSYDVMPELAGFNASFGVTLGDIVFDNMNLYDHLTGSLSTIGIPMRYVAGNHDNDYSGNTLTEARGVWLRTFGPTYYSFTHGPVHFVILDDIRWIVEETRRYYRTGLGKDQMEFLRNEIKRLGKDQLLVLCTHIPYEKSTEWESAEEKIAFYELIASHPNTISLAAHTHRHYHQLIGREEGFPGDKPHHLVSVGTVCGSWWAGAPDEYGIPHAMMSDGTPNCYTILHIDGNRWKMSWKAPRRPADFQMHIYTPDVISSDTADIIQVTANIFNALPSASVKMKIGDEGEWIEMENILQGDPFRLAANEREKQLGEVPWTALGNPAPSEHIWSAGCKLNLAPGVHIIYVKASDQWWEYEGKRLIHVK